MEQADEGSPVVRTRDAEDLLVGIASFNELGGCNDNNNPGLYTRVDTYRDWILSTITKVKTLFSCCYIQFFVLLFFTMF